MEVACDIVIDFDDSEKVKTVLKSIEVDNLDFVDSKINGKKFFTFRMGSMLAMGGINKWGLSISVNLIEVFNYGCLGTPISVLYRNVLENTRFVSRAEKMITC